MPGAIGFTVAWRDDDTGDRLCVLHQADRDAPVGHAIDEGAGAVDRVDHPGKGRASRLKPIFLAQHAIIGKGPGDPATDQHLDLAISR
jgi:hypothetical protein